ncbi:MAG: hypothetical protein BroJett014_19160 [Planctomycetota bacterium]|nr:hypothetical protein [Planctomycetota bacterium]GIK52943.1 MAG: hypothetical protein BroJett014_19160 [Planctomycetota bacterium]
MSPRGVNYACTVDRSFSWELAMAEKPSFAQINIGASAPNGETLLVDDEGAALFLKISTSMFRKLIRMGKAPLPLKLGACARWRVDELRAWVRADCPDRERWITMRDAALAADDHCVAPDDKMKKSIRAAAA